MAQEDKTPAEEPKKEKKCKKGGGAPEWMITYSDMVTLLLTFFVLLLSMAEINPIKVVEASHSLQEAFGLHPTPRTTEFKVPLIPTPPITQLRPVQQEMTTKVYDKVKAELQLKEQSENVELQKVDATSLVLRTKDSVLFQPGEASLNPVAYPLLRSIAEIVRDLPVKIRIEGHTDDIVHGKGELGNYDLSVARAVAVMRFFKEGSMIELERMAAAGYGQEKPLVDNKNDESRAKNRRVDFILQLNTPQKDTTARPARNKIPL